MDDYNIIIQPHITEKTMNAIDQKNQLTFEVLRTSNKKTIKQSFEKLYDTPVKKVNTQINPKGIKLAYITLIEEGKAEDLAVKIGVF